MGREFNVGDEPVPGYRLVAMLGKGGFGTVWRAAGPGRTEVALKITDLLDSKRGMREFKSLRLMKRVRHPNLVPIVAIWLIDSSGVPLDDASIDLLGSNLIDSVTGRSGAGTATLQFNAARAERLIVGMGLGEKDLLDLLHEYQAKGEPSIPVDKLLDYMEEAAKAIDFLNEPRHELGESDKGAASQLKAIYHCDIKPSNIMLVGSAAQVCDFGLARREDVRATSVALSCAYGAPELYWENKSTQGTDQYSLAITYYELRTGELPFEQDLSQLEVMQLHRDGKLDFRRVGEPERAVLKRATNPKPHERYPTCKEMVAGLRMAVQGNSDLFRYTVDPRQSGFNAQQRTTLAPGRQLVPGYRLGEHLFHADTRTDVWSATGPGGKHFSLWIYDLTSLSETVDLGALRTIQQQIQHANVARVSGWWCLNAAGDDITAELAKNASPGGETSQLVIASEFSRTHLGHKVQERRELTDAGIPADELMDLMRQAAGALDALNAAAYGAQYASLLHTDVRAANFLLIGNTVKLANLAWCRMLVGDEADVSGLDSRPPRITMAPELLEGRLHRRSDQFSLAVSYVQLRSGKLQLESALPSATTQILAAPELDLSALSAEERTVVDRALSREPRQRFSNCQSMVEALAQVAINRRVPELVPAQKESSEFDRGTAMADMLSGPAAKETDATKHRETRHRETRGKLRSTTQPDMPLPASQSRGRLKPLFVSAAVAVAAAAGLYLTGAGQLFVPKAAKLADDKPGETTESTATESSIAAPLAQPETIEPIVVPETPPKSPDERFALHLTRVEKQIDGGKLNEADDELKQATSLLEKLHEPAEAGPQLKLTEARLAVERKQWDAAEKHLDAIDPAQLVSAAARTRYYLLRALSLARFDGELGDDVDLKVLGKAIDELRRHIPSWQDASYRRDRTADKMTALIRAAMERTAELSADENADAQAAARGVLAAFNAADIDAFDRDIQVPFALATVNTMLADGKSTWKQIEPAWQHCTTQAAWLSRDDTTRLGTRLLAWSKANADPNVLAEVLKAYESLGDLPPSPEYAGMCMQVLQQLAAAEPIDWPGVQASCNRARTAAQEAAHPRLYFVELCEAECALELERDARKRAREALRRMPVRPARFVPASDEAYFHYVAMRVEREDGRQLGPTDADRLCDAFAQPSKLLAGKQRRTMAADMLIGAAQTLAAAAEDDPLGAIRFSPVENADRAYHWLTQAKALNPGAENPDFPVLLAAASLDKKQPVAPETLPPVPEEPLSLKRSVLLLRARAAELRSQQAEAVRSYAELLRSVDLSSAQSNLAVVYSSLVKPALDLADKLSQEDLAATKSDIGYLQATKGRLLRLDVTVAFNVYEESQGRLSGPEAVFDAYDKAIEHDPSVADYYIQRGTARYNSTSAHNDLKALKSNDIAPASKLLSGQESPGLASLTGVASLLEGRAAETRAQRVELFKQAEAQERQAVDDCDPRSEDYPQFLLLHSMACLELANWTTEPQQAIRGHLDSAVASADKAIADGRGARPDLAYQALGNAQEDFGLLLLDHAGYRQALRTFETARLKASENPLTPPYEALLGLGRARYRLAESGAESPAASEALFQQGLADLQAAAGMDRVPATRVAEAFWWQVQIHDARMRRASDRATAAAVQKNATIADQETRKFYEERKAAAAAMQQALGRVDRSAAVWPLYQLSWASLGAKPEEIRERARAVLGLPAAKTNGAQREQAISLIANSYVATLTAGERRRKEFDQGLKEFAKYVPALDDAGKDDVPLLLALGEFILPDTLADLDVWRDNRDRCQKILDRALSLTDEVEMPDLRARAHGDLAKHLVFAATQSSTPDLTGLRAAADHLKKSVELDDNLAAAPLMAWERQRIHKYLAGEWRRDLAGLYSRIAASSQTPPADAKKLCQDGLKVLNDGKDLPAKYAQSYQQLRLTIFKIQQQLPK